MISEFLFESIQHIVLKEKFHIVWDKIHECIIVQDNFIILVRDNKNFVQANDIFRSRQYLNSCSDSI